MGLEAPIGESTEVLEGRKEKRKRKERCDIENVLTDRRFN
jgi:hypothetical protein